MKYLKLLLEFIKSIASIISSVNEWNNTRAKNKKKIDSIKESYDKQLKKDEAAVINNDVDHIKDIFK